MDNKSLTAVNTSLKAEGINYAFQEWNDKPIYPYWVGEYIEVEPVNEDGYEQTTFYLNGFARGESAFSQLEADKETIKQLFDSSYGKRFISDGSAIAIFYGQANGNVPTQDPDLKRMEITLTIKEWKGEN